MECSKQKKQIRKELKTCKKYNFEPEYLENFKKSKKKLKAMVKNNKEIFLSEKLKELYKVKSSAAFWIFINSFKKNKFKIDCVSLDAWQSHLKKTFPEQECTCIQSIAFKKEVECLDKVIELDEIKSSLVKCKNNKSSGPDLLPYEFFKYMSDNGVMYLKELYNKIINAEKIPVEWTKIFIRMIHKKGDMDDPGNYRSIALANSVLKILTLIFNNRLSKFIEYNKVMPEFQSGFRANRSTMDNVFILNSLIQIKLREKGSKLFALFVDFKEAFPSVKYEILWEKLRKIGASAKFINIFRDIYDKASVAVKGNGGYSQFIKVTKGLLKGEPTSPLFFQYLLQTDLESYIREGEYMVPP